MKNIVMPFISFDLQSFAVLDASNITVICLLGALAHIRIVIILYILLLLIGIVTIVCNEFYPRRLLKRSPYQNVV